MLANIPDCLTKSSAGYLDWRRFGVYIQSKTHKYSVDELAVRTAMLIFSGYCAKTCAEADILSDSMVLQSVGFCVGFVGGIIIAHPIAMVNTLRKRHGHLKKITGHKSNIEKNIAKITDQNIIFKIRHLIAKIEDFKLSSKKESMKSLHIRLFKCVKLMERLDYAVEEYIKNLSLRSEELDSTPPFIRAAYEDFCKISDENIIPAACKMGLSQ